jgi:osmotically-inducible protein OsmY
MRKQPKRLSALALSVLWVAALPGCTVIPKCAPENCAADAEIKRNVQAVFAEHAEFGAPGTIRVQSINKVVYLNGLVNSDFERQSAEALALAVPDVKEVVNSIAPRSNSR